MGSNPAPSTFFFTFSFFLSFSPTRDGFESNLPPCTHTPPPPPFLFIKLFLIFYIYTFYVHLTIPSNTAHHQHPQLCYQPTLSPRTPTRHLPLPNFFWHIFFLFWHFHRYFNSSYTSTKTPPPTVVTPRPDPPPPPDFFFFEFPQKFQFFVHIHPDPPTRPPPP